MALSPGRSWFPRRPPASRRGELRRGVPVVLPAKLRRVSARGWGPWTDAVLDLGGLPDGEARWRAEDPVAVGFAANRGPVELPFSEVEEVYLRSVRFRAEAFWGMDAEIVVVRADTGTTEISVPGADAEALADRLSALLLG